MDELPAPDIRIGESERGSALEALGEHMRAGRLTLDEYGDRSAQTTVAPTRAELSALFADLPDPRPDLTPAVTLPPSHPPARRALRTASAVAIPAAVALAVTLYTVTGWWQFFLLIPMAGAAAASVWGEHGDGARRGGRGGRCTCRSRQAHPCSHH